MQLAILKRFIQLKIKVGSTEAYISICLFVTVFALCHFIFYYYHNRIVFP